MMSKHLCKNLWDNKTQTMRDYKHFFSMVAYLSNVFQSAGQLRDVVTSVVLNRLMFFFHKLLKDYSAVTVKGSISYRTTNSRQ